MRKDDLAFRAIFGMLLGVLFACSSAVPPCEPRQEQCNGRDDDCDGRTDEDPIDVGTDPCGSDTGECQPGLPACEGGRVVCRGETPPSEEICDNRDNDCDGDTDEALAACACTGGAAPGTEVCNGIDDDCDGTIDDIAACACTGGAAPGTEACNGIDDDCDGTIDDLAACACTGGGAPGTEVCNGIDDDCDGTIDDVAACACTGGAAPGTEVCNGIDDDCDNQIDESNGAGGRCGGLGEPCSAARDCISGVCVGDVFGRYCSQVCDMAAPDSCLSDWRCVVGSNMDYCLKNFPPCDGNADCSQGQVCVVLEADDQMSRVTECRPALDPGVGPGADCSSAICQNALCAWIGLCTEVCSAAEPCANAYQGHATTCVLRGFSVTPGDCGRDVQCPAGATCQGGACAGPVCASDADCPAHYACDTQAHLCRPEPFVDYVGNCVLGCMRDAECPTVLGVQLVCQPGVAADGTRIQGQCNRPYSGGATGEACQPGCDHGICFYGTTAYCSQLCQTAADCPPGMNCTPGTLYMGELGNFANTMTCTWP